MRNDSNKLEYSEGLSFGKNYYGECVVTGIGSCTDIDIIIPPESPSGDRVTQIAEGAFASRSELTSVYIPENVMCIDDCAFSDCANLRRVRLPESLRIIGVWAFADCAKLEEIFIAKNVGVVDAHAFENCTLLRIRCAVDSPPKVWSKEWNVSDCPVVWSALRTDKSISDETDSVCLSEPQVVDEDYFSDHECVSAYGLDYRRLGNGECAVTSMGSCKDLDLVIPTISPEGDIVTAIDDFAFMKCEGLLSVKIPDSVTKIGVRAFGGCRELTSILIPNSVVDIAEMAFMDCEKLTIACSTSSMPNGWDNRWNPSNCPVIWGAW